jgi:hypothetical protein
LRDGSRFGDELAMWALFERSGEDRTGSSALTCERIVGLDTDTQELVEAMRTHGLVWD